jgi:hypothetical protein
MKNTFFKALSLVLALVTALSCFASVTAFAEGEVSEPASEEKVIWELDFDELKGKSGTALSKALIEKGLYLVEGEGNSKANISSNITVDTNGMLKLSKITSVVPYQRYLDLGFATAEDTTPADSDVFYNLFYGLLTTDGKAMADDYSNQLKEYYFDYDFRNDGVGYHSINLDDTKTTNDDLIGYYKHVKTVVTKNGAAQTPSDVYTSMFELPEGVTTETETVVVTNKTDDKNYTTVTTKYGRGKITYNLVFANTRGESIFTVMAAKGSYVFLTKLTPNGVFYSANNGGSSAGFSLVKNSATETGTYSASRYNPHLSYIKKIYPIDANGTVSSTALTERNYYAFTTETEAEIKNAYNNYTRGGQLPATKEWNQGNLFEPGSSAVILENKKVNKIRIAFRVDGENILAKVYTKPIGEMSDGAWTYVGERSYTYSAPEVGTSKASVRFNEYKSTCYFDNFKLWTPTEDAKCANGHLMPVNQTEPAVIDNNGTYAALVSCARCGYTATNKAKVNSLISLDFTNMTTDEIKANTAVLSRGNLSYDSNRGGAYVNSSEFKLSSPIKNNKDIVYIEMNVNFEQFPTDQDATVVSGMGSSFLTFMSSSSDYSRIYARVGRVDPSNPNSDGWIKISHPYRSNEWANIHPAAILKRGQDYKLTFVMMPENKVYHLFVDDVYQATGSLSKGYPLTGSGGYPAFRVCNSMNVKATFKQIDFYTVDREGTYDFYSQLVSSNAPLRFENVNETPLVPDAKDGILLTNSDYQSSVYQFFNDDVFGKPYNFRFDFKIDDGYFDDSMKTGTQYWSLLSMLCGDSSSPYIKSLIRVGAVTTREDGKFEKFFIVPSDDKLLVDLKKEDTGYQSTADSAATPYYSDDSAIYYITPGEWVTISGSFDPLTGYAVIYADNQLILNCRTAGVGYNAAATNAYIRVGDTFRKFIYKWSMKDVVFERTDLPLLGTAGGEIYNNDFIYDVDFSNSVDKRFGHLLKAFTSLEPTVDKDGNKLARVYNGTNWKGNAHLNLYTTTQLDDGTLYDVLAGDKYAISLTFALNHREYRDGEVRNETNSTHTSGVSSSLVRFSKYSDKNNVKLVSCSYASGLYVLNGSKTVYLSDAYGNSLNGWTTVEQVFDEESGALVSATPAKWTKLTIVIDESRNTATYYVNDSLAYYSASAPTNGKHNVAALKPAVDVPFVVTTDSAATVFPGGDKANWDGMYGSLPYDKQYTDTRFGFANYIRLFQNTLDACVKELSITRISDNKITYGEDSKAVYAFDPEIEFIGTQTRILSPSNLNFDMRFVFGADSIYADKISYKVSASVNGGDKGDAQIFDNDAVFGVLRSDDVNISAAKYEGNHLSFVAIEGIEYMEGNEYTITIMPEYVIDDKNSDADVVKALDGFEITVSGTGEVTSWKSIPAAN